MFFFMCSCKRNHLDDVGFYLHLLSNHDYITSIIEKQSKSCELTKWFLFHFCFCTFIIRPVIFRYRCYTYIALVVCVCCSISHTCVVDVTVSILQCSNTQLQHMIYHAIGHLSLVKPSPQITKIPLPKNNTCMLMNKCMNIG